MHHVRLSKLEEEKKLGANEMHKLDKTSRTRLHELVEKTQ